MKRQKTGQGTNYVIQTRESPSKINLNENNMIEEDRERQLNSEGLFKREMRRKKLHKKINISEDRLCCS